MYITLYEQFQKINDMEYPEHGIRNANPAVLHFLYQNFADWDWYDLPEGDPPYENDVEIPDYAQAKLMTEFRKLYVFKRKDLSKVRRESMFIDLLQSLSKDEAKFLLAVKDKKLTELFPNITRELVDRVHPTLLVQKDAE